MEVLELYVKGKKRAEIAKLTDLRRNTVDYALKSGQNNINEIMSFLEYALKNNLFDKQQIDRLKKLLRTLE